MSCVRNGVPLACCSALFLNPSVASAQQINSDIPAFNIQSNARLVITQAALVLYLALIERDVQTVANSIEPYHSVLA
jgi:hypothetical protein